MFARCAVCLVCRVANLHISRPTSQPFIDVYLCALKGGFLQQGRLYVYQQHVCFHANVFGHHTHLCIPGKEIHRLDKCSNLGFPNSIRVRYGTKKVIFSSFLKRHEAYKCVTCGEGEVRHGTASRRLWRWVGSAHEDVLPA